MNEKNKPWKTFDFDIETYRDSLEKDLCDAFAYAYSNAYDDKFDNYKKPRQPTKSKPMSLNWEDEYDVAVILKDAIKLLPTDKQLLMIDVFAQENFELDEEDQIVLIKKIINILPKEAQAKLTSIYKGLGDEILFKHAMVNLVEL